MFGDNNGDVMMRRTTKELQDGVKALTTQLKGLQGKVEQVMHG